jgi:hypothetical protein
MSTWRSLERWTEDDAAAALAALKRSGLSVAHFADREGIDPQRLYAWRRRLGSAGEFVELAPRSGLTVRSGLTIRGASGGFEVMLRSGHLVRLAESFDAEGFRRLIAVLEGEC